MDLSDTLSLVRSLQSDRTSENHQSIVFEVPIQEIDLDSFQSVLSTADTQQSFLTNFRIEAEYENDRPASSLISIRSGSLIAPDPDSEQVEWLHEFSRKASFYIQESRYGDLVDTICELSVENVEVRLGFRILKRELESAVVRKSLEESQIKNSNPSIWTSVGSLSEWVQQASVSQVADEFFEQSSLPVLLVLNHDEEHVESGILGLYEVPESGAVTIHDYSSRLNRYLSEYSKSESMFKEVGVSNPVPATIFSTQRSRSVFRNIFVYSFICSISETATFSDDRLSYKISSDKQEISGEIDLSSVDESELSSDSAFEFISKFYERGEQGVYRDIWHKAIVEHCESVSDIPRDSQNIIYYYDSLEQNAIEGNFTELSGAVQDAQIFIGDVTNTISTSTVNLTAEVQKVVIAIFSIIGVNAFLIARNNGVRTAVPFTTVFLAGLLIFYLPIAQSRVSEIESIIDEGEKDAEVYSELAQNVGADAFVDIEKFESRQESYIGIAEDRVDWANHRLRLGYILVSFAWLLTGSYGLLKFPVTGVENQVVFSSIIGAIWIWGNRGKYDYIGARSILLQIMIIVLFSLIEIVKIAVWAGWVTI